MNGHKYIETLKRLEYPQTDYLDGANFDWLFENETILSFLKWFCSNVDSNNLLCMEEKMEYKSLERENAVLEGADLDPALQALTCTEDVLTNDQLREDIDKLAEDIAECKKRKKSFVLHRNKLSSHVSSASLHIQSITHAEARVTERYQHAVNQLNSDNAAMNTSLDDLAHPYIALTDLYRPCATDTMHTMTFLSQCDLENYHKHEAIFTQQLTTFTKKQFFDGIADMAGQNDACRYEILDVTKPQFLLVREDSQTAMEANCKEFSRLQSTYPTSERDYINSLIAVRTKQAILSTLESVLASLAAGTFTKTITTLSQRVEDVGATVSRVRSQITHDTSAFLFPLIEQNSFSLVSSIMTGDYDLKICRQDYFTSNQDQVIRELLVQRAHYDFLAMAYDVEARANHDLYRLTEVIRELFTKQSQQCLIRIKLMEEAMAALDKYERNTVDSRDTSTLRLAKLIAIGGGSEQWPMYISYDNLIQKLDMLCNSQNAIQSTIDQDTTQHLESIFPLEYGLQCLEATLYAGSSTTTGKPYLTPHLITDRMAQLTDLLEKLECAIKEIVRDVDSRNKVLLGDELLNEERNLWLYFFTNPDQLEKTISDLDERIEALVIE